MDIMAQFAPNPHAPVHSFVHHDPCTVTKRQRATIRAFLTEHTVNDAATMQVRANGMASARRDVTKAGCAGDKPGHWNAGAVLSVAE